MDISKCSLVQQHLVKIFDSVNHSFNLSELDKAVGGGPDVCAASKPCAPLCMFVICVCESVRHANLLDLGTEAVLTDALNIKGFTKHMAWLKGHVRQTKDGTAMRCVST